MKSNIYLSYSGRNCEAVLQVMEAVIRAGFGLVCDCMLPAHSSFEDRVSRGIKEAELVIAVITDDAENCSYMDRELEIAFETGARLLLVVVGEAKLPSKHAQKLNGMGICYVSEYPTEKEMAAVVQSFADIGD